LTSRGNPSRGGSPSRHGEARKVKWEPPDVVAQVSQNRERRAHRERSPFGLLRAFGIKRVFGNPGSAELPFLSDRPDDSVPPRLTASLRICSAFRNLNTAAWPPTMSNENVEPAPVHCLANRRPAGEAQ
jgi:hypothetical protein